MLSLKKKKNNHNIWQGLKTATALNCVLFKYRWWEDTKKPRIFSIFLRASKGNCYNIKILLNIKILPADSSQRKFWLHLNFCFYFSNLLLWYREEIKTQVGGDRGLGFLVVVVGWLVLLWA